MRACADANVSETCSGRSVSMASGSPGKACPPTLGSESVFHATSSGTFRFPDRVGEHFPQRHRYAPLSSAFGRSEERPGSNPRLLRFRSSRRDGSASPLLRWAVLWSRAYPPSCERVHFHGDATRTRVPLIAHRRRWKRIGG